MRKIFLVIGATGEYSDHTQWNVAAYPNLEEAELHVERANEFLQTHRLITKGGIVDWDARDCAPPNPFDPKMVVDCTGAKYAVQEVAFFAHPDEFLEREGQ